MEGNNGERVEEHDLLSSFYSLNMNRRGAHHGVGTVWF
jgi:hypothetical protein